MIIHLKSTEGDMIWIMNGAMALTVGYEVDICVGLTHGCRPNYDF